MSEKKEFDFFDRPSVIKKLWIMLYVVCGLTVVCDFFIDRHGHFGFDSYFGFYAVLGFISCAVLILVSKLLGIFLKVDEDYYDK